MCACDVYVGKKRRRMIDKRVVKEGNVVCGCIDKCI